ncbi:hypothetical protein [Phragmitibacter flavus]|nr:hypothetical protein [Phragmitibacter flavus]
MMGKVGGCVNSEGGGILANIANVADGEVYRRMWMVEGFDRLEGFWET